jgi:predicted nucleic acid-binding protein
MYLLDSNVFIEAKNRYYAFDLAPGFWQWVDTAVDAGDIGSIDQVGHELTRGTDDLSVWARSRPEVFRATDALVATKLAELSIWATGAGYTSAAVSEFLSVADYYLVAHAAAYGYTVVTHEQPQAAAKKRVLIPNACIAMGVKYCDTFTMLRSGSVQFGLLE